MRPPRSNSRTNCEDFIWRECDQTKDALKIKEEYESKMNTLIPDLQNKSPYQLIEAGQADILLEYLSKNRPE